MPAKWKPDRIEASQAGNGPLSGTRESGHRPDRGLTRSVQTSKNNSLQCRPREELRDRARSYPERR